MVTWRNTLFCSIVLINFTIIHGTCCIYAMERYYMYSDVHVLNTHLQADSLSSFIHSSSPSLFSSSSWYNSSLSSSHSFSNNQSVEGADHQSVVQLIRQSGKEVILLVVSVSEDEARRLEPETSSTSQNPGVEYYERRSVPVSINDTEKLVESGKEYVVSIINWCIYLYLSVHLLFYLSI